MTDAQWALIEPVLTAWKAAHPSVSGHEGDYELREIVNAIRYQGTDKTIHDLLHWHLREKKRLADPSLVADTQSVHVAAGAPTPRAR